MKTSVYLLIASSAVLLAFMAQSVSAGGSCLTDANCNQGTCNNGTCVCTNGYVDFGGVSCNYQQKEKLTAFLLSFLIGTTGADWFYLAQGNGGYITAGIFKLLTGLSFIFACIGTCCIGASAATWKEKAKSQACGLICGVCILILVLIMSIANGIWVLVDWIRILAGSFPDGNGVALKNW